MKKSRDVGKGKVMNGWVRVWGGRRLVGEVVPIPNKNALVAVLPAAILADGEMVYKGVPETTDVVKILAILEQLGAKVRRGGAWLRVDATGVDSYSVNAELGGEFRASLMCVGPLLARFGRAEVPLPGGCKLGMRHIESHTSVFSGMGVEIRREKGRLRFVAPEVKRTKRRIWQLEASPTATENFAMFASGREGEFELVDAACEPHVVDLLRLLSAMGAQVEGAGSNRLRIWGRETLKGATFEPRPDFVDIAGYMVAAAVTDGEIRIKGANDPEIVDGLIRWFEMFNISVRREGRDLKVKRRGELVIDVRRGGFPLAAPGLAKLVPRPWPGFPVDVVPAMAVLASKSRGRLLLQNWMYESGFEFVRELNNLGADIFMADPQRIIVNGPVRFKGGEVAPPEVIQATKAVFLASLCDPVETVVHGVAILKRRYPDIFDVYRRLGAKIEGGE